MIFGLLTSMGFYFTTGQFWTDVKTIPYCIANLKYRPEAEHLIQNKGETIETVVPVDYVAAELLISMHRISK